MSDSTALIRSLILFGIVLPLAILLGYLAAYLPNFDYSSMVGIGIVLALICLPLLLHWHHQLLFLSWNMVAVVFFLPGRPELWLFMALASFTILAVQRTLSAEIQMIPVPWMLAPLLFILAVVVGTAYATGGIHLGSMGSESLGGRKYLYMIAAVLGFVAMTSLRIPEQKAGFYVGAYFLGGLTYLAGHLVQVAGSWLSFILYVFPTLSGATILGTTNEGVGLEAGGVARDMGLTIAGTAVVFFMLARYGLEGLLRGGTFKQRIFRRLFFMIFFAGSIYGGFRSYLILILMTMVFMFWLQGLSRTKYVLLPILALFSILALAPFAGKMPAPIQRTLSFLPVTIDPIVREEAENSSAWRLNMWKKLLPDVPRYFWLGKGCETDSREFVMTRDIQGRGKGGDSDTQIMAGDFHNGPLSIMIPFGIWGMLGWLWFLAAGLRLLYLNHRHGKPHAQITNTLLLALFMARIILFFAVFGSFESELMIFAGLVAMSICLNGGVGKPQKNPAAAPRPTGERFKLPVRFSPDLLR